ncbi:MAG: hypothetical protein NZ930_02600 [Candidatus Bipolaricaulota bacterium]|nr:hypothetical protein [Candidatus Bipolaricaulota bacterium]MDW8030823.1 hypothetical protein [Candidatus Bipolaricaulota bacterium]
MSDNQIQEVFNFGERVWLMRRKSKVWGWHYYMQIKGQHQPKVESLNRWTKVISWVLEWLGFIGLFIAAINQLLSVLAWPGAFIFLISRVLLRIRFRYFVNTAGEIKPYGKLEIKKIAKQKDLNSSQDSAQADHETR